MEYCFFLSEYCFKIQDTSQSFFGPAEYLSVLAVIAIAWGVNSTESKTKSECYSRISHLHILILVILVGIFVFSLDFFLKYANHSTDYRFIAQQLQFALLVLTLAIASYSILNFLLDYDLLFKPNYAEIEKSLSAAIRTSNPEIIQFHCKYVIAIFPILAKMHPANEDGQIIDANKSTAKALSYLCHYKFIAIAASLDPAIIASIARTSRDVPLYPHYELFFNNLTAWLCTDKESYLKTQDEFSTMHPLLPWREIYSEIYFNEQLCKSAKSLMNMPIARFDTTSLRRYSDLTFFMIQDFIANHNGAGNNSICTALNKLSMIHFSHNEISIPIKMDILTQIKLSLDSASEARQATLSSSDTEFRSEKSRQQVFLVSYAEFLVQYLCQITANDSDEFSFRALIPLRLSVSMPLFRRLRKQLTRAALDQLKTSTISINKNNILHALLSALAFSFSENQVQFATVGLLRDTAIVLDRYAHMNSHKIQSRDKAAIGTIWPENALSFSDLYLQERFC